MCHIRGIREEIPYTIYNLSGTFEDSSTVSVALQRGQCHRGRCRTNHREDTNDRFRAVSTTGSALKLTNSILLTTADLSGHVTRRDRKLAVITAHMQRHDEQNSDNGLKVQQSLEVLIYHIFGV